MKSVLHKFITEPLFDATEAMLSHLHIKFTAQSKIPLSFAELYSDTTSSQMPQALQQVVDKINSTYLIGAIDEDSLEGRQSDFDIQKPLDGKYQTMLVFAVDIKAGLSLTRGELATLTRGFNRMAPQLPVVVFVKNGDKLTLATCERSEYRQYWREGEKLGKVSILRDINCAHPHRGHIDILETLGDEAYPTFDELYKHWLAVFSSELLTKKFYTELSEWYAWVINSGEVKFPNDITTTEDDTKFNHEAVIRLITRLIFVWFLKQKHLIPNEFFDEKFITEHFIENFDPHSTDSLFYDPKQSKYYRLILQNLFFAMLNRPIKDEESGNDENRRFVTDRRYKGLSIDYNINNLLRYRSEFKEGGADRLLELANSQVPFLNGGLFECLDDKDNGMYYDGFSERKASLEQLSFPDYFFFGEEVGQDVDLSAWYDDKRKNHVHVHSLINILNHYNFTVEENTPLDQEVSLDPELLGKVFENLLASYNPETNTTARKQTGSFYTPRDIVKYMVDESLIAHLKRTCPALDESVFRSLFDYSVDNFDMPETDRKEIMSALYNCKVLDPACGSGAFPMGILQQMVHALRKLDPTNEMWREFILDISLKKDKEAYQVEDEEERTRLRADIEQSFNRNVNDPDYARKLYLIENCIYGVDIQPIATQISKLRFFISLVAEQKPTNDAAANFGIRPLPNLEAKIVAANSLIPLGQGNIFTNTEELSKIKERLAEANHKLFTARRNADKRKIRTNIVAIRKEYADELIAMGAVDDDDAMKLAKWNMFEQNEFAKFFDAQWMFGISDGFDVVIGNPPYTQIPKGIYSKVRFPYSEGKDKGKQNLYKLFVEHSYNLAKQGGIGCMIVQSSLMCDLSSSFTRELILKNTKIQFIIEFPKIAPTKEGQVFASVCQGTCIYLFTKEKVADNKFGLSINNDCTTINKLSYENVGQSELTSFYPTDFAIPLLKKGEFKILKKVKSNSTLTDFIVDICQGDVNLTGIKSHITQSPAKIKLIRGRHVASYKINYDVDEYVDVNIRPDNLKLNSNKQLILVQEITGTVDSRRIHCALTDTSESFLVGHTCNKIELKNSSLNNCLMAILNSKLLDWIFRKTSSNNHVGGYELRQLPILIPVDSHKLNSLVESIIKEGYTTDSSFAIEIDKEIYHLYGLNYQEVLIVDPETTITEEEYNCYE